MPTDYRTTFENIEQFLNLWFIQELGCHKIQLN